MDWSNFYSWLKLFLENSQLHLHMYWTINIIFIRQFNWCKRNNKFMYKSHSVADRLRIKMLQFSYYKPESKANYNLVLSFFCPLCKIMLLFLIHLSLCKYCKSLFHVWIFRHIFLINIIIVRLCINLKTSREQWWGVSVNSCSSAWLVFTYNSA